MLPAPHSFPHLTASTGSFSFSYYIFMPPNPSSSQPDVHMTYSNEANRQHVGCEKKTKVELRGQRVRHCARTGCASFSKKKKKKRRHADLQVR